MGGTVARGEAASRAAAVDVFQDLNAYATRPKSQGGKGYSFLDYDALVWYDRFNDIIWIAEGRGIWLSAATRDFNEQSEAVCVCGDFTERQPLYPEIEGTALAIHWAIKNRWIVSDPKIIGHRDNPMHPNATSCPGSIYEKLPTIRSLVRQYQAPPPPPAEENDDMYVNEQIWNGVRSMPPLVDVKAGRNSEWFAIAVVKAMYRQVTGSTRLTQEDFLQINALLAG